MKKNIFYFILGAIVCGITGVVASNLMANNVTYTPNDSTWGVNNVEAAIDSLYISKTSNNYSTDEKIVGTWIDGKPLYQKTIIYTGPSFTSGTEIFKNELSALNIDFVMKKDVTYMTNGTNSIQNDYTSSASDKLQLIVYRKSAWVSVAGVTVDKVYLTIQYTKTTDSAS